MPRTYMDKNLPHTSSFYANKNMKVFLNLAVRKLNILFNKLFFTSYVLRVKCKNITMKLTLNPEDPGSSSGQVIFFSSPYKNCSLYQVF